MVWKIKAGNILKAFKDLKTFKVFIVIHTSCGAQIFWQTLMLKKIPLADWASPASGEQLLPSDYRPSNQVAIARRAKPINNSQKLDPPTIGRATKLPIKPSKPMTTAIIQVTFFGAERFILVLLVFHISQNDLKVQYIPSPNQGI
jgi:hypothetical protein